MEQRPDQVTWPQRRTAGARTCKRQALTWRALSHHLRARCPAVPGLMGSRLVYALGVRPLPSPLPPISMVERSAGRLPQPTPHPLDV